MLNTMMFSKSVVFYFENYTKNTIKLLFFLFKNRDIREVFVFFFFRQYDGDFKKICTFFSINVMLKKKKDIKYSISFFKKRGIRYQVK